MPQSIDPPVSSPALDSALAWLAQPPAEDPLRDLVPLRNHLDAVDDMGVAPLQLLRILDLFQPRIDAVHAALKPLLHKASLPIDRRLRTIAQGLLYVHGSIVAAYGKVMREADISRLPSLHRNPASLSALAIRNLAQQMELALLISSPLPPDMWNDAQAIYRWTMATEPHDGALPASTHVVLSQLKAMLALAAAQPESFTPAELDFLLAYLHEFAVQVELADALPSADHTTAWYWINEDRGQPPCAAIRRPPPARGRNLCFCCRELGSSTLKYIEAIAAGGSSPHPGLDERARTPGLRQALHRAASRWVSPPRRHSTRQGNNNRVQVCTDLAALWHHLRGEHDAVVAATDVTATDWMLLNESAGGLAVMHVAGDIRGIRAGSALAVQPSADRHWGLYLVRWARSDNPEHLELGLELIAPAAEAVRLVRHAGSDNPSGGAATEAFRLPPLAGDRRGEALLAETGIHAAGAFTLVSDNVDRIQLTDCMPGALLLQTSSVELFEFTRDFSPSNR